MEKQPFDTKKSSPIRSWKVQSWPNITLQAPDGILKAPARSPIGKHQNSLPLFIKPHIAMWQVYIVSYIVMWPHLLVCGFKDAAKAFGAAGSPAKGSPNAIYISLASVQKFRICHSPANVVFLLQSNSSIPSAVIGSSSKSYSSSASISVEFYVSSLIWKILL